MYEDDVRTRGHCIHVHTLFDANFFHSIHCASPIARASLAQTYRTYTYYYNIIYLKYCTLYTCIKRTDRSDCRLGKLYEVYIIMRPYNIRRFRRTGTMRAKDLYAIQRNACLYIYYVVLRSTNTIFSVSLFIPFIFSHELSSTIGNILRTNKSIYNK